MTEAELHALAPAPLDAALGLALHGFEDGAAVLRLEPPAARRRGEEPEYLHGGALATCVDTAAWYAVVNGREGEWVMVDMRCDFVRMAAREPHRVEARCLRAGRMLALVDVRIAPWDRPDRAVASGGRNSRASTGLMFRRNRFGDLIARQLDLFGEENPELLVEIGEYRERWRRASREGAEEAYGDEQDRVDWAAEALSAVCDRYAATLDEATEAEYRRAFTKAVRRRLPALADEFEAQTDTGR